MAKTIKKPYKILLSIVLVLVFLLVTIPLLLLLPPVQTYVTSQATSWLKEKYNVEISIGSVAIKPISNVALGEVYVSDLKGDTLAYLKQIDVGLTGFYSKPTEFYLGLNDVELIHPVFYMNMAEGDTTTNLFHWINQLSTGEPDTTTSSSDFRLDCNDLIITNGSFKWDDNNEAKLPRGVDWSHIGVDRLDLHFSQISIYNDSVNAFIHYLKLNEQSGFELDTLHGLAIYSNSVTQVDHMLLKSSKTRLEGALQFSYADVIDYSEFNEKVYMKAHLDSSTVGFEDVSFFVDELFGLDEQLSINANVRGTVDNLRIRKGTIGFGQSTYLKGDFDLDGLPNINSTFMRLDLDELQTNYYDLSAIPTYPFENHTHLEMPEWLLNAGELHFKGSFTGFISDFVAYGDLNTSVGDLRTDIKLNTDEADVLNYRGQLIAKQFNPGKIFETDAVGKVSLRVNIDGKGFSLDELIANVGGEVYSAELQGYNYKGIELNGSILEGLYQGEFSIKDHNIALEFNGKADLLDSIPVFEFTADIDHLKPVELKLLERDSSINIKTKLTFNFQGNSIDNIIGRISLDSFHLYEGEKEAYLEYVNFLAHTNVNGKTLSLESPELQSFITGKFTTTGIVDEFSNLIYQFSPAFFSEAPKKPKEVQDFSYEVHLKNFTKFSKILIPGAELANNVDISGSVNSVQETMSITASANKLSFYGTKADSLDLSVNLQKDSLDIEIKTEQIGVTDSLALKNVLVRIQAHNNQFKINTDWDNTDDPNFTGDLNMNFFVKEQDVFDLVIDESQLTIVDSIWTIQDSSSISYMKGQYSFTGFKIFNNSQELFVNGSLGDSTDKRLDIETKNFQLSSLNPFLVSSGLKLDGKVNGDVYIDDPKDNFIFGANFDYDSLRVNEFELGSGKARTQWLDSQKKLNVNANLNYKGLNTFLINGNYFPENEKNKLDVGVSFTQFPIQVLDVFLYEFVSTEKGGLTGTVRIKGDVDDPKLSGNLNIIDLKTKVNYLNTTYTVPNGQVFIDNDLIGSDQLIVKDESGRIARCNISIFHENFSNFNYDIWLETPKGFKAMDLKEGMNDIFYGKAILTPGSSISLESTDRDKLRLIVEAGADAGTEVYIPLSEGTTVESNDFVHFVDYSKPDSLQTNTRNINADEGNLEMKFDLAMQKDAVIQLILDPVMGDAITANGEGDISLEIDSKGNFKIFGTYELSDGSYLFTLENVINKRFKIMPGSRITWDGDPYNGLADITAQYNLRTSLIELQLPSITTDSSQLMRRVDVSLNLHMTGNYMNPNLEFSFDLPTQYSDVESVLNNLEEGEKNKQVFGLLLLNKFFPITSFEGGLNNAFGKSTSEMLSNQLSNWLSQISDDFDLGVNYRPGDQLTSEEVDVMMSTQLFNDRVTVETNVGVQGDNPNNTAQNGSQIVGDFLVEYKISEDGRVKGKAFNRSNTYNPIYSNQAPFTQGAGVSYQEDFSSLPHLYCRVKSRFMRKEKQAEIDCDEMERQRMEERQRKRMKKIEEKIKKKRASN